MGLDGNGDRGQGLSNISKTLLASADVVKSRSQECLSRVKGEQLQSANGVKTDVGLISLFISPHILNDKVDLC